MRKTVVILTLLALLSMCPKDACAQEDYRFDAGGGFGMTGYLGDANMANLWSNPDLTPCSSSDISATHASPSRRDYT